MSKLKNDLDPIPNVVIKPKRLEDFEQKGPFYGFKCLGDVYIEGHINTKAFLSIRLIYSDMRQI